MRRYGFLPPLLFVIALLGAAIVTNMRHGAAHYSDTALMMDTVVEIDIYGKGEVSLEAAADSALACIARLEHLFGDGMVDTRSDSTVLGSREVAELVALSEDVNRLTRGCFDPTVGSVTRLWDFWEGAVPPPADSIAEGLKHVGLERYLAGEGDGRFIFDFGGIAKGYAVDMAAAKIRRLGFKSAIINAGGDLDLIGRRPDGKPWRIAIRDPRRGGAFLGYLELEDEAVATSGDYERCFIWDGKRYHHILDPATGMPGMLSNSVTVISKSACLSDALATGLFLMGPKVGLEAVASLGDVEAVFAYAEGESIAVSGGLGGRFTEVRN
jgi:thiamine biosynthesis lipoprotein